jgi:hypothetical protein
MIDFVVTTLFLFVPIVAAFLLWRTPSRASRHPGLRLIGVALACILTNGLIVLGGLRLNAVIPALAGLEWNWAGKIAAVLGTLLMMRLIPETTPVDFGLTLRQRQGSIRPAVLATIALCAFSWTIQAAFASPTRSSAERLLYQAFMPGLDEELFFRGLLLAIFLRAFGDAGSWEVPQSEARPSPSPSCSQPGMACGSPGERSSSPLS